MKTSEQIDEIAPALLDNFDLVAGDVWAPVPGASDYIVNKDGEVVSFARQTPRVLSPIRIGDYEGYQIAHDDGVTRKVYRHRLVLRAWRGEPPEGHEARHLDGDRSNNSLGNLRWGTRSQNHRDKHRHGTAATGEKNPMSRLNERDVREMRRLYASGDYSYSQLADRWDVATMTAYRAVTGETWSHLDNEGNDE